MCNKFGGKLEGACGMPSDLLRKAASMAGCKINIDTDIRLAMTADIRRHFGEKSDQFDPRGYLGDARTFIEELVKAKILDVLGSKDSM